jgi:transcriptional regulator with XRE-family HTH domain
MCLDGKYRNNGYTGENMRDRNQTTKARSRLREAVKNAFRITIDPMTLKGVLEKLGMSNRELARRSGLTHTGVNQITSGECSPTLRSLEKIFEALVGEIAERYRGERLSLDEFATLLSQRASQRLKDRIRLKMVTVPAKETFAGRCQRHAVARFSRQQQERQR